MMYFTPAIDKYFANWITADTWHTGHWADEERFYLFVKAVDFYSRALKRKERAEDNGDRPPAAQIQPKARNPRTYQEKAMREKIFLAVQRNHPKFDKVYAQKLAEEHASKAILILDYSWYIRQSPFGSSSFRDWNPPLL